MGRPWPQPGESLFTEQDTLEALALQEDEDATCGGCGRPIDECMDPANAEAYMVTRPVCFACRAREHVQKATHEGNADSAGMRFVAHLAEDDDEGGAL